MKKRILNILIASLLVSASLAGCGSESSSSADTAANESGAVAKAEAADYYDYDMAEEPAYEEAATDDVYDSTAGGVASGSSEGDVPTDSEIESNSNRKLIKTVNMTAETKEFDALIANISDRISELGGYAQSMEVHGNSYNYTGERSAYIIARIPATKLDFFVKDISDSSNITSKSETAEDVTLQYADVEAHKESLKIEQARLNELLEKADTLENIIELENRLTQVRYEIESYESRLRTMNNQIVYSTVNLSVQEVRDYTPEPVIEKTFGQRLSEEFLESCANAWDTIQDFVIGFVAFLPTLVVLLIILGVIFIIVFGIVKAIIAVVKKSNAKKAEKRAKNPKLQQRPVASAPNAPGAQQTVQQQPPAKPASPEKPADSGNRDNG